MNPLSFYYKAHNPEMEERGKELLKQGVLGCLILAGGEGTRLKWKGSKGTYPITECKKKSLFQLFCEKVKVAGQRDGVIVPLAIMTSPPNTEATRAFFEQNSHFGLKVDDLSFFEQEMLPLLDHDKQPTDEKGPDGNGYCFKNFVKSGIFSEWKARGIKYVHVLLVDNALADPCDAELLGVHASEGLDWTVKCIERLLSISGEEKTGVLVEESGKLRIVEYSELPKEIGAQYALANTGMHCVSMDLISRLKYDLPLHLARKKRGEHWFFKQEAFIFDLLPQAKKSAAFLCDRAQIFAPLKNKEGEDSPKSVRIALQKRDRACFETITGAQPEQRPFELDPAFYYPTEELLERWKGRDLPTSSYIDSQK